MKFLIMFLISFSAMAGYMKKVDLENCNKPSRTFYLDKNKCAPSCVEVPKNYKCETFSELDTEVDDYKNPIFSKSEPEVCDGQDDCESKLELKECADEKEKIYINKLYTELYCSKFIGYGKKTVKMFREDPDKRAAHDAEKASKNQKEADRKTSIENLKNSLNGLKSGGDLDASQRRSLDILLIEKLF